MRNNKHPEREIRLTRNVLFNMVGTLLPLPVAIFTIPVLIETLGTDRFGILTIAWMFVGYFNLFDFGMSRALVKLLSEKIGLGRDGEIVPLIWTALTCLSFLGLAAAMLVALLSPVLVGSVLKIPIELQTDSLYAFYILSASIPVVITNTALRGILESYQYFGAINAVRVPLGIFNYLGPLLVLPFYKGLVPVVLILVFGRLVVWCVYGVLCIQAVPGLMRGFCFDYAAVKHLVKFGSWMTVSNIIGPVMVYFDRIFIGMFISVSAIAYYTTPYEVATKLWLITGALMPVLFPALSASLAEDKEKAACIFGRGTNYIFVLLFPITLFIVLFAHEGLSLWISEDFAVQSSLVLKCIAVGVFINSLAQVFFAVIQGYGRPDLTAKIHLVELPLYLAFLWWAVTAYGVAGAAVAWTGRVAVDCMALAYFVKNLLPDLGKYLKKVLLQTVILCAVLGLSSTLVAGEFAKGLSFVLVLGVFAFSVWKYTLSEDEKNTFNKMLMKKVER